MAGVPRELLDGMAEFAAGLRRWSEWRSWFVGHAWLLVRVMDRPLFERLKKDPEGAVAALLKHEGVSIRAAEPRHCDPADGVSPDEYAVYSAVCRQLDLFRFTLPDTLFENHTDGDSFGHSGYRAWLTFDEARREYQVVEREFAERFALPFRRWFTEHPEMFRQYESRNQRRWPLEHLFAVENGYRFLSELSEQERELGRAEFCLSRVGFAADGRYALVFIRCAVTCSYYFVFERTATGWERAEFYAAWVT